MLIHTGPKKGVWVPCSPCTQYLCTTLMDKIQHNHSYHESLRKVHRPAHLQHSKPVLASLQQTVHEDSSALASHALEHEVHEGHWTIHLNSFDMQCQL